jgi:hydroxylamine reductase (hybrid-cluster protein)
MPLVLPALQCEQTKGNVGCDKVGVCGKTPQVAILQDLLIYQLKVRVSTTAGPSTAVHAWSGQHGMSCSACSMKHVNEQRCFYCSPQWSTMLRA